MSDFDDELDHDLEPDSRTAFDQRHAIARLLEILNEGGDPETIGRRALMAGRLFRATDFSTQAELARHLGLTEGRVSQLLKELRESILSLVES